MWMKKKILVLVIVALLMALSLLVSYESNSRATHPADSNQMQD